MDLFKLLGSISVNNEDAISAIDAVIERANTLYNTLNTMPQVGSGSGSGTTTNGQTTGGTATPTQNTTNQTNNGAGGTTIAAPSRGGGVGSAVMNWLGIKATQLTASGIKYGWDTGSSYNIDEEKALALVRSKFKMTDEQLEEFKLSAIKYAKETPFSPADIFSGVADVKTVKGDATLDEAFEIIQVLGELTANDISKLPNAIKALTDTFGATQLLAAEANQFRNANIGIWDIVTDYYHENGRYTDMDSGELKKQSGNKNIVVPDEDVWAALKWKASQSDNLREVMNTKYGKQQLLEETSAQFFGSLVEGTQNFLYDKAVPFLQGIMDNYLNSQSVHDGGYSEDILEGVDRPLTFEDYADLTKEVEHSDVNMRTSLGTFNDTIRKLFGYSIPSDNPLSDGVMSRWDVSASASNEKEYIRRLEMANALAKEAGFKSVEDYWDEIDRIYEKRAGKSKQLDELKEWEEKNKNIPLDEQFKQKYGTDSTGNDPFNGQKVIQPFSSEWWQNLFGDEPGGGGRFGDGPETYGPSLPDNWVPAGSTFGDPSADKESIAMLTEAVRLNTESMDFSELGAAVTAAATAGVQAGMSGITITGTVTTGNVVLNTGALVGTLTPRIDLKLGGIAGQIARG